ncbi:MAG: hypothetical protein AAGD32_15595 [Planctomycetota bacterium]
MADHCPFVNRDDKRCSNAFRLNRLSFTYSHCFSDYATCPTYAQLLDERREARAKAAFVTLRVRKPIKRQIAA